MTNHEHDLDPARADHLFIVRVIDGIEYGCRLRVYSCGCIQPVDAAQVERGAVVKVFSAEDAPEAVYSMMDEYIRVARLVVPMRNAMSKIELLAAIAERAGADHTH